MALSKEEILDAVAGMTPVRRLGTPDDIGAAAREPTLAPTGGQEADNGQHADDGDADDQIEPLTHGAIQSDASQRLLLSSSVGRASPRR